MGSFVMPFSSLIRMCNST